MRAANDAPPARPLLEVRDLRRDFVLRRPGWRRKTERLRAVDGVSFDVATGETLGIVGESGCGKTTVARLILRLIEPHGGEIRFDGEDLLALRGAQLRRKRRDMQMVFQDPFGSLDPRQRVGDIVGEGLRIHGLARGREPVVGLLDRVGLPADSCDRYAHEFSGGQRQRISIARALAVQPRLIVADEPVSALDVSVQAQIVNLLQDLQEDHRLTYIVIAHDLRVVEHFSHRVAIMYLGQIVELADRQELYANPRHPYTRALISAVPAVAKPTGEQRLRLGGEVPSPVCPPPGCAFHPRCPRAEDRCRRSAPELEGPAGHRVACHLFPA